MSMMEQLVFVDRDAAKRLFGTASADDLTQFVRDLIADSNVPSLSLPERWPVWEEEFHNDEVEPKTLQWTLSGGQEIVVSDNGSRIQLKRPDVVRQIAGAVQQSGGRIVDDPDFAAALQEFYSDAAEKQVAVIFASWPKEN
jgi:hypothetical protein